VLMLFNQPFKALADNNEETLMKSATFVSFVALALLLGAPWLCAQPNGQGPQKITVDVPIDFMVGQLMFPAGNYTVKPLGNRTFRLQADRGRESVKFATEPISTPWHPGPARLIFSKENAHYQLRELWMNSTIGARILGPQVKQVRPVRESRVEVPASCTACN
jgi:hypothetical protein